MMNSVLGRGIFICHHSFFTETKERETRFCEGLFFFPLSKNREKQQHNFETAVGQRQT